MKTTYISNETEARKQAAAPQLREEVDANGHLTADEAHLREAEVSPPPQFWLDWQIFKTWLTPTTYLLSQLRKSCYGYQSSDLYI